MPRWGGALLIADPSGTVFEQDTLTCKHCQHVIRVPVGRVSEVTGWCARCGDYVCLRCADLGRCRPFEQWLATVERKGSQ